ncbi:lysophospholipid acyltransferase family protein [Kerstersia similis]|uniref:lysophospholipid acyltransferase family protein n=1 Tax=Kerstersia similis TaxID=206505 RepID=UPI0039F0AE5E
MIWLRSLIYAVFLTVTVIPYALACLLWAPLPRGPRYKLTVGWAQLALWGARTICGIRWQIKGQENLPDGPAVLLSKHQSAWETLFFPAKMPRQVCYVYKKELHYVPFFGWGLALLRMIPIDRKQGHDAFSQVLSVGQQRLAEGRWPLLFPEGTRVPPGQHRRYKMGGARLAAEAGVPVIPIALNAGDCWPRNSFLKYPGLITVSIGPAIDSAGLSSTELNARVEAWIEAEMRRISPQHYPGSNQAA